MEFRLLGPLEVVDGASPVLLGNRKQRALLARLLLDANRAVAADRLIGDLWGDNAPASAPKMVQIFVSQLRKALPDAVLLTRRPGYVVSVSRDAVDVNRFNRLRVEGRAALEAGDAPAAAALLVQALGLWRGPALAEFSEPFAEAERIHLEELRLTCLEDRIEADLALGRHDDVVAEVTALVAEHPFRERPHRHLILGLYRAGRQAEALEAYERFRRALDQQLGIEPSPELKGIQRKILNHDSSLELGSHGAAAEAPPRLLARGSFADAPPDEFYGRADELERLETLLQAANDGRGSTVLVAGRAGIGKSRLVAELLKRARGERNLILDGRCLQLGGVGLPYLPFVDALRPLSDSPVIGGLADELRELPRLIPDLPAPRAPQRDLDDPAEARLRLFQEFLLVLEELSRVHPVVLALEDVHWADTSTIDLIAFLAQAVARERILLVCTYRSEDVGFGEPLQRLASRLPDTGSALVVELEPLQRDAIKMLAAASRGAPPSEALVDTVYARSEGNPFFAKHLLAATARGDTALPAALREMLLANVGRLPAESRPVLRAAAAAGRDVSYELLRAVTPLDEQALAEALRQTVEHGLLVPHQAAGTFRFPHALAAEAVYDTLLPGEREILHERIARALTENPGLAVRGAAAAEAAHHWLEARRPAEALAASLEAAREAEKVSGLSEALRHVERVLALWDEVPDAEELAGVALPVVLSRAAQLAHVSADVEEELDLRRVVGVIDLDDRVDAKTVAGRLGIATAAAARWLSALEDAGLVERCRKGYRAAPLAISEARRLYPAAIVLESVAVRRAPRFAEERLRALRAANERFRAASDDAAAAVVADDEFHRTLIGACGNEELVAALLPIKRALLRYERVYMADDRRIGRSAHQHDAIVDALERGDNAQAARLLQENLGGGLPELTEAMEGAAL